METKFFFPWIGKEPVRVGWKPKAAEIESPSKQVEYDPQSDLR
jgi:hypothetical protein